MENHRAHAQKNSAIAKQEMKYSANIKPVTI